jgi:two-component system sensor histidine kinase YesM
MIPVIIIIWIMPSYFQGLISRETKTLTESILDASIKNIEIYLNDLERLTLTPYFNDDFIYALSLRSSGEYEKCDEYSKLVVDRSINSLMANYFQNTRKDVVGAILLPFDGSVFAVSSYGQSNAKPGYPYSTKKWYKDTINSNGNAVFISAHPQDYLQRECAQQVFSVARLIKEPFSQEPIAVMMADADAAALSSIVNDIKFNVTSIVSIFDDKGNLLYSTGSLSESVIKQILDKKELIQGESDSYEVVTRPIDGPDWEMAVMLSHGEIKSKVRWMYNVGVLFALFGILLTSMLFITLSTHITKPFGEMKAVMKRVENGDTDARFVIKDNDEIGQLGNSLNNMISHLNELIDREYRAVLNQRNAEYFALQSQIQPHFLYNTLNGFIGLNRIGDRDTLEKAILSLTSMLRYIIEHESMASISEEFLFIQRYCELQQLRFDERILVDIKYMPDTSEYKIPKLILQPIVENAIIHGAEPLDRQCKISVSAQFIQEDGITYLQLLVKDDGAGFKIDDCDDPKCLGNRNVIERLKIAYKSAVFNISSQPGSGTEVNIKIPKGELLYEGNNS